MFRFGFLVVVSLGAVSVSGVEDAPYNGAACLKAQPLGAPPSDEADEEDPNISVTRLLPNTVNSKDASSCSSAYKVCEPVPDTC